MSLATRCPSCSTVFRLVQDQLKVSEGWVRCGRCDAVFSALEGLLDLEREAPAEWSDTAPAHLEKGVPQAVSARAPGSGSAPRSPSVATMARATAPARAATADLASAGVPAREPQGDLEDTHADPGPSSAAADEMFGDRVDAHLFGPRKKTESAPKPAGKVGARDRLEFSDARFDSDLFIDSPSLAESEAEMAESTVSEAGALALESAGRPDFLRRAERRARWRSRPARAALAAGSALALLALLLQIGHHDRDLLAARFAGLQPLLAAWCERAGCVLRAPRRIKDLMVDNSTLTRTAGVDSAVLSVILRNRAPLALSLPWVDLSLTDSSGRVVARKALAPGDFRAAETIQAGAEAALHLTLSTGTADFANYTVYIFYP